jgi:hypothetical protein
MGGFQTCQAYLGEERARRGDQSVGQIDLSDAVFQTMNNLNEGIKAWLVACRVVEFTASMGPMVWLKDIWCQETAV